MKKAPEVGTRWRFSTRGALYEIVESPENRAPRKGYVHAKTVSSTTDEPIGGRVELAITALGSTYKRVKKGSK